MYESASSTRTSRGRGDSSSSSHHVRPFEVAYAQRRKANSRFCAGCEWWVWLVTIMLMVLETIIIAACIWADPLVISTADMGGLIHRPLRSVRQGIYDSERHLVDDEMELGFRMEESNRAQSAKQLKMLKVG